MVQLSCLAESLPRLFYSQFRKQIRTVLGRADILKHFFDITIWVDQECGAKNTFIFLAHEFLGSPYAVLVTDFMTFVREQGKG